MTEPILEARGIRKTFGEVLANDQIDFDVRPGEIHSILGENGAGKTTFMNVVYGAYEFDAGEIRFDGEPVSFDSPQDALERGVGLVYQEFKLIPSFSVLDNILIGIPDDAWYEDNVATHREQVRALSEEYGLGLAERLDWQVAELSEGEKQRVEILKALYRDLDVLLLDEPTSILTPQEVDDLFEVLEQLVEEEGLAIVFITHKLDEVMAVSDRITVFRQGESVATTRTDRTSRAELARLIVGDDDAELIERVERDDGDPEPFLEVRDLRVTNDRGQVAVDLSLTVGRNEIVGLVGVEGNGQTELVEALTGLRPIDEGSVHFGDTPLGSASRGAAQRAGVIYLPAAHGIVDSFSLRDNSILDTYGGFYPSGYRDEGAITEHATRIIDEFEVVTPGIDAAAEQLSGGNKQKLLVGRKLAIDNRELFIAVNPTKGLDIGTKQFIHQRLVDERDAGRAVLLVTADIEEALALADRLVVVNDGRITGRFEDVRSARREEIGIAMTGRADDGQPAQAGGDD
jgi:simple sugar transport system ATP-binding protein